MRIVDRLQQGDVIYTSCVGLAFCYHIGIVHDDGKKKTVFHNSPVMKNRYSGSICSQTYEEFVKNREVLKIVRTNTTQERILTVSRKHKKEIWDTFFFNCEDYILEIVEGHRRSDLRDAWKIAALGILLIALY